MLNNIDTLTTILTIVIIAIVILIVILSLVYLKSKNGKSKKKEPSENIPAKETKGSKEKNYTIDSVMNFMEFDKVEDNMIIQKDGNKFIMVIECQGINYDLMSEVEKML